MHRSSIGNFDSNMSCRSRCTNAVEVHLSGKYLVQDLVARHSFIGRRNSDSNMLLTAKYPKKIPVSVPRVFCKYSPRNMILKIINLQIILERAATEKNLIDLERRRFLVPEDLTLIHFQAIIRRRLKLAPEKALFFLINGQSIVSLSKEVVEIYNEYKAADSFLHIFYASEDCFGRCSC